MRRANSWQSGQRCSAARRWPQPGHTTLAVAELRLTPGTPVWTTVKATDVDGYAAEPDQPVPGPPI